MADDSLAETSPAEQPATGNDNQLAHVQELSRDVKVDMTKRPYSIYTPSEKWFIVGVSAFAALFSPFTANIYFPAIPTLAAEFHTSIELINLTVTVYMIVQGISPMFWGTLADRWGRRPMTLACMVVLTLSCVGLALVPTKAYYGLMLLRCLQAAGSASTVALGAGIIADIASPQERGTFFGIWNIGPMVGPCIGPVIGGALADGLGWRSIFWFLCIASAVCFVIILLLLPETLRALVGDGSIPPPPLYKPLIPIIGRNRVVEPDHSTRPPPRGFANPLKLFLYPDVTLLLVFNAILYSVFYGVTTSISTLFQQTYPFLNETDIGLCFLAIGGGMLFGGVITGQVLDREYKRRITPEDVTKDEYFPIEQARLRLLPVYFAVFVAVCIGYGWALEKKVSIAGPLILQIILGYMSVSCMNITQTLIVDLVPTQSSAVTACNNLVRCSFGAGLVSVIDLILNAIGPGWTYVLLAGICVFFSPLMVITRYMGPKWRARRRARRAASSDVA
ncbi:major facilitator superfamily domain-containing protein [Amylocystis lapponica]|nr:major facilitator superfamily domain-containing protein [Amylocystis lapponica]